MNVDNLLKSLGESKKTEKKETAPKIQMIHYSKLIPNKGNFYQTDDIEKLAAAIRIAGEIKNPLRVRKSDIDEYEVNEGHRRRLATIYNVENMGLKKFEFVPCIVEDTENIVGRLNLILSNSTQRERTEHEKMVEVEKLRDLLEIYAKENEKKISSIQMRELISSILGISKTKVAQLQSINRNLIPEAKERFEKEEIPVSVANEMAGLPEQKQHQLMDKTDIKLSDVKKAKEKDVKHCKYKKNLICNIESVIEKHFTKSGNIVGCSGCCELCSRKHMCEYSCEYSNAKSADLKDQMSFHLEEDPNSYYKESDFENISFSFFDVKDTIVCEKRKIKHLKKSEQKEAVHLKVIIESLESLLKKMMVKSEVKRDGK